MPASTPLGITYPCSGETINPAALRTYAQTTQAAISAVQATAEDALYPPAAQGRRIFTQQNINAGVSTQMTWETEVYDSDAMTTAGSGTFTIQTFGTYVISVQIRNANQPLNFTSVRIAILVNGVEVAAHKTDAGATAGFASDRLYTANLAPSLPPGTIVTANALYTGPASPMGLEGTMSIIRAATV